MLLSLKDKAEKKDKDIEKDHPTTSQTPLGTDTP
jgi:hypothetical protein